MQVDYALILAAGKGTRMGEIGKKLPKVLWPVFEKSILELEAAYAKELGAKRIFINTHYHTEKILRFVEAHNGFEGAEFLIEDRPIDIGGAIHNLARKVNYTGNLLVLNSDQFIFLDSKDWDKAFKSFENNDALIFGHEVSKEENYNGLEIKNDLLAGIRPNDGYLPGQRMLTYTGMSLIKLDTLKIRPGESKFFESVVNPSELSVAVQSIANSPYWDFGTLRRYWESCFKALRNFSTGQICPFLKFLEKQGAFKREKVQGLSYGAKGDCVIDLSNRPQGVKKNKIILKESVGSFDAEAEMIIYENLAENVP